MPEIELKLTYLREKNDDPLSKIIRNIVVINLLWLKLH